MIKRGAFLFPNKLEYRPDIDGLRALAVLAVVFYHAKIPGFRGGFVGVDVFFVISGYLISKIILESLESNIFSLASFYKRRFLRIFPALLVMLLGASLMAYSIYLEPQMADFGKELVSAVLSISNIHFAFSDNYFAAREINSPLLHTWSLGVEEQFYLLSPVLFSFIFRKYPNHWRTLLLTLTLYSFILSAILCWPSSDFQFYMIHTRIWEFLMGSLLAIGIFPSTKNPVTREALSTAGACILLASITQYSDSTPFPGLGAVIPCLGTALIIATNSAQLTWVGLVLSWSPLVFVGLISYSLYLWHWPVMVFQKSLLLKQPLSGFATISLSFLLAVLSWRFIETPFRYMNRLKFSLILRCAIYVSAALVMFGSFAWFSNGIPWRFSEQIRRIAVYNGRTSVGHHVGRHKSCHLTTNQKPFLWDETKCLDVIPGKKNYLLWGDSHAAHLWLGMSKALPDINFLQATAGSCHPTGLSHDNRAKDCMKASLYILHDYLKNHNIDKVILVARWGAEDLQVLGRVLDTLKSHRISVLLLGPINEYTMHLPLLLIRSISSKDKDLFLRKYSKLNLKSLDLKFRQLAAIKFIPYVSLYDEVCGTGTCETLTEEGVPLQYDNKGHLTKEGSVYLMRRLALRGALN